MTKTDKVSVIIPSYNYAHYLEECVRSVLEQTYSNWEAIIVDDGSSDNTPEVGQALVSLDPSRISFYRKTNGGVSQSRNFGIEHSTGEYLLPLDADDKLLPSALEQFVEAINKKNSVGFSYCPLENYGAFPGEPRHWLPGPCQPNCMRFENVVSCTALWRKDLWKQGVKYRELIFEDWDLWLQILAKGYHGEYIPRILFQYRRHPFGRHSQNIHYYFLGLMQEIQYNPSLYPAELMSLSNSALANAPESLKLPTIVCLPDPQDYEYRSFSGVMADLAFLFLKQRHLVIAMGDFPDSHQTKKGLILRNIPKDKNVDYLLESLRTFGNNIMIITSRCEAEVKRLRIVDNVFNCVSLNRENRFATIQLKNTEQGTFQTRHHLGLKEADTILDHQCCINHLLNLQKENYRKDQEIEKNFWARMRELNQMSFNRLSSTPPAAKELSVVIPSRNPDLSLLEHSLQSLRGAKGGEQLEIIIADLGSAPEDHQALTILCERYQAILDHYQTACPWNKSKALNAGIRKCQRPWVLCLDADHLLGPDCLQMWQEYLDSFGSCSIFLLEQKMLPPNQQPSASWCAESFSKLKIRAYLGEEIKPAAIIAPASWLREVQGFNEALEGSQGQIEELLQRAKISGLQEIWLQSDHLLQQWHLKTITANWQWNNESLIKNNQSLGEVQINSDNWGIISEEEKENFRTTGPAVRRHELDSIFARVPTIETMIRQSSDSTAEIEDVLIAWGHHLLNSCCLNGAQSAYEDVLAINPDSLNALEGIMRLYFQRGLLGKASHYACLLTGRDPENPVALEVLKHFFAL